MNVFLLVAEDAFYLPPMLHRFFEEKPPSCDIVGAAVLDGTMSLESLQAYARLMGWRGFTKNALHLARCKLLDGIDRYAAFEQSYSVTGALRKHDVLCHHPADVNQASFRRLLREADVDLVVSISCPQIVREDLLKLPAEGVINVHGALLPEYRGLLPSFWVLARGEGRTGVTVHYMNKALDDGPIIVQREVPIRPGDTLHSLVLRSKVEYGAPALAEAVTQIARGEVVSQENPGAQATYFSFPDSEAIAAFRQRGRRIR